MDFVCEAKNLCHNAFYKYTDTGSLQHDIAISYIAFVILLNVMNLAALFLVLVIL